MMLRTRRLEDPEPPARTSNQPQTRPIPTLPKDPIIIVLPQANQSFDRIAYRFGWCKWWGKPSGCVPRSARPVDGQSN